MALTQADLFALTPDQIQALTAKGYLTPDLAGQILQQKQALDTQGPSQFDNIQASLTGAQAGIVKPTQITSGNLETQGPTWKVATPPPPPPPDASSPPPKDPSEMTDEEYKQWFAKQVSQPGVRQVRDPNQDGKWIGGGNGTAPQQPAPPPVPRLTDADAAKAQADASNATQSATPVTDSLLASIHSSGVGGGGSSGPSASQVYRKGIADLDQRSVDATKAEQKATSEAADIQSGYEAQMAQALDYARQDREAAFLRDQAARQKVNDAMEERDKKIQAEIDAVKDIDPRHWFKEAGVGGSILAALSMGLGALGSGLSGIHGSATPNYAMQIIDNAINRDMQAQKDNLETQWNKIAKEQGLSNNKYARDQWIVEQQSQDAEKKYNLVLNQLDSLAHQSKSEVVVKNAEILNAQIEQRLIAIQQKTQDRMYAVAQEDERKAAAAAANSPAAINARKYNEADKAYGEYFKTVTAKGETPQSRSAWIEQYLGGTPVGQVGGGKIDDALKNDTIKKRTAIADAKDALQNLKKWYDRSIPDRVFTRNERDALRAAAKLKLAKVGELGALSGGDLDIVNKQVGGQGTTDPFGFSTQPIDVTLGVLDRQDQNLQNILAGKAPQSGQQTNPVPGAQPKE